MAKLLFASTFLAMALHGPAISAEEGSIYPDMRVLPGIGGQAAVSALGSNLAAVADYYGKTIAALRAEFLRDPGLRLDREGMIYAITLPQTIDMLRWSAPAVDPREVPGPANKLHSKPGAASRIYLNFEGGEVEGYFARKSGGPALTAPAFSLGDSQSTETMIKHVWQRVAEDFAAFDVDVTTDADTGHHALDATVLVTSRVEGICTCGSAAYVDAFSNSKSVLVFTDHLNNAREKSIAEAISQALGRNLGLWADGVTGGDGRAPAARYGGAGLGKTGWAPIMGDGTYKELTQFSRGGYAGASNGENDFTKIEYWLNLRPDDVGNDVNAAYSLAPRLSMGRASASFDGVLGLDGDADVFGIYTGEGPLNVSLASLYRGGNTDLKLTLLDRNGAVLQTSDPRADTSASLSTNLAAGTYFLKVEGAASANAYGNVGAYRLTADYPPNTALAPLVDGLPTAVRRGWPVYLDLRGSALTRDGAAIQSYSWTVSGGDPASIINIRPNDRLTTIGFQNPGTYEFTLRATDVRGYSNFSRKTFIVGQPPEPPDESTARMIYQQGPALGYQYIFMARTELDAWGIGSTLWQFEDGGEVVPARNPYEFVTHVFPGPGSYKVRVYVRDRTGKKFSNGEQTIVVPTLPASSQASN